VEPSRMVNVLVINCGSSSIKYKLFGFPSKRLIAGGLVEKIGDKNSKIANHSDGVRAIITRLLDEKFIKSVEDINSIGHRVVHGGVAF
jgi:acetate kinase